MVQTNLHSSCKRVLLCYTNILTEKNQQTSKNRTSNCAQLTDMPQEKNNNAANICGSIHSADSIDPFEGLDLDEICVPPQTFSPTAAEPEKRSSELFDLHPLDTVNLDEISVSPATISRAQPDAPLHSSSFNSTEASVNHTRSAVRKAPDGSSVRRLSKGSCRTERTASGNITDAGVPPISPVIEKAYHYAELTRIREKIFASFENVAGNILLIASPRDNTGSTLLTAALGYNAACSCQQNVLLIDCNMRRAGLHNFYNLPQAGGFTEFVKDNLPWQTVVKRTGISNLDVITAGARCKNFSDYLRHSHIPKILQESRLQYDFIIFDTSPVLSPNRNNVNIVSLTSVADYFLLITKKAGTTRADLKETKTIIEAGNGSIDGIVLNEHNPEKQANPYPHQ